MDKKVRLNKTNSSKSVNEDVNQKISLMGNSKPLPYNDIRKTVNEIEQFNKERNESGKYRVISDINTLMSNPLFNVTGENSWETYNSNLFRDRSYPPNEISLNEEEDYTYRESLDNHMVEKDGWFGFYNPKINESTRFSFNHMKPGKSEFEMVNVTEDNWKIVYTYPYDSMKNEVVEGGLKIVNKRTETFGGKKMTALGTPFKHNLKIGDYVRIYNSGKDGVYEVKGFGSLGKEEENYFGIDVDFNDLEINETRFRKVVDGIESDYYFRIFKKLKTTKNDIISNNDLDKYPLNVSNNIFGDKNVQVGTKNDIDIDGLVDNLGRPLSEFFLTFIKVNNKGFSDISSGLLVDKISNIASNLEIPNIRGMHNGNGNPFESHKPLENRVSVDDDSYVGDLVEYNKSTLQETVISDVYHRFNTLNRENGGTIKTILERDTDSWSDVIDIDSEDIWHGLGPNYNQGPIILFSMLTNLKRDDSNEGGYYFDNGGGFDGNKEVFLRLSENPSDKCSMNGNLIKYYISGSSFRTTTALYMDEGGARKANTGYYFDGFVNRYWKQSEGEFGETIDCTDNDASDNTSSENEILDLGNRQEGYMYKPFHKLKIKEFSKYIEVGDEKTGNIPEYATKFKDNKYRWRDILSIGIGNVDYPFTNGSHYLYNKFIFHLKRQDPHNLYKYGKDIKIGDVGGYEVTDDHKIKKINNDC